MFLNADHSPAAALSDAPTLTPAELVEGRRYLVRGLFAEMETEVNGPLRDSDGVEFYIVEDLEGGFDIEWRGDCWDAGELIGAVHISECYLNE